ncbi:MAG: endolytic transglycosylase MltG [Gammaproteobacteria bacterium]|nr:endolytic transglycosylase MltG [Gammaproteobacteria bacterium]
MTEQEDNSSERRETRTGVRLRALALASVGLVALAALGGAWLMMDARRVLHSPMTIPPEGFVYELASGTTLRQMAAELADAGVLEEPRYLVWQARIDGRAGAIKAGEYDIRPGTTPLALLDQLVEGRVLQHALTVVEGWTFAQLLASVAAHPALDHTLADLPPETIMERIGYPGVHPEGRFFADTYHFPRHTTDRAFLRRAYDRMSEFLAAAWPARASDLPLASPEEALVLASLVEKETGAPEERPLIASVFVNRLRRGMRLETDPSVIYGLGEAFDGNLRRADLRRDTPYNTYTRKGLPPTPIAIPGAAAIRAVLHPARDDALFFVAKGDGSHYFSETYEEHREAVERYQLGRGRDATPQRAMEAPGG